MIVGYVKKRRELPVDPSVSKNVRAHIEAVIKNTVSMKPGKGLLPVGLRSAGYQEYLIEVLGEHVGNGDERQRSVGEAILEEAVPVGITGA